jgi:hypothetical protein
MKNGLEREVITRRRELLGGRFVMELNPCLKNAIPSPVPLPSSSDPVC